MSRLIGKCDHYKEGPWHFKCPREKGVWDSEKCLGFRVDCGYYAGTVEPARPTAYTTEEYDFHP